jgi:uptake hydrogenase large subunit
VLAAPAQAQDDAALRAALSALATEHVFAEAPQAWLARQSAADFTAWLAAANTPPAQALRRLWDDVACPGRGDTPRWLPSDAAEVCAALTNPMASPDFARQPRWAGTDAETGALARQRHAPLLAALLTERGADAAVRLVARLRELALLLTEGLPATWLHGHALPGPDGTCTGVGAVQTARGLLLHRARLARGVVADYAVLAPTEWNFAADGALVRALAHRACGSEAEARAATRLMVQALDPCVACSVEFDHA